jgi:low affinity Fe/Cu permease
LREGLHLLKLSSARRFSIQLLAIFRHASEVRRTWFTRRKVLVMNEFFRKFAHKVSAVVGSAWAFVIAVTTIVIWAVTGPIFDFSDTWQLVINTGTTIVTFLMVFLIQNTQNRDAKAIHLKLDELIKGLKGARTSMVDLEDLTDEELEKLQQEFQRLHERYNSRNQNGNGQANTKHNSNKRSASKKKTAKESR